uniref:Uncharacterized protein n=1 Tax=Aegilops tauschii subsp. strangulata TaxID=200361 RepID=A0A453LLC4_AEGTS
LFSNQLPVLPEYLILFTRLQTLHHAEALSW